MPFLVAAAALFSLSSAIVSGGTLGKPAGRSGTMTGQAGAASSAPALPAAKPAEAPQSDPALTEARSLLEGGKFSEAEASVRQFLQSHVDSADAHFLLCHILFGELHQKYLEVEKTEGQSFEYQGNAGGELGKERDAKARASLAEFAAGANSGGTPSAADLKTAALDYVLLRDNFLAAKYLSLALKADPNDAEGWYFLGRMRYSQDQSAGAIEAFEQCLKLDPRNVLAEAYAGLAYEGLKQNDEAMQAYQNAVAWEAQRAAKSPEPYIFLSRLYLIENQPEKAVPPLIQAVADFPDVPALHEQLGKAYATLHQFPQAQEQLEKAAALEPNVAGIHFLLGQVYRQLGMMDKAKAELQRADELYGTHSSSQPPG